MATGTGTDRLTSADRLTDFAGRLFEAADAVSAEPAATLRLAPGGVQVAVRVAGAELAAVLTRSLAPFAVEGSAPAQIDLLALDTVSCGTSPPPPPWPRDAYRPRDEIAGFGGERLEVSYALHPGTLYLWDEDRRRGIAWTHDAATQPPWDVAAPLRSLLRWGLRGRGLAVVHGAVVGDDRGAVLLAGVSGSGKSTSAIVAMLDGMRSVGDDHCVIELGDPPVAHGLYGIGKAEAGTMRMLPQLAPLGDGLPVTIAGKQLLDLSLTGALTPRLPLRAIVLPHVAGAVGDPQPVSKGEALVGLGPATLVQLPGSRPADSAAIARLASALPAFRLPLGPDPAAVVGAIDAILTDVTGAR